MRSNDAAALLLTPWTVPPVFAGCTLEAEDTQDEAETEPDQDIRWRGLQETSSLSVLQE